MRYTVFKACKELVAAAVLLSGTVLTGQAALSETLTGALVKAYKNNAPLNSSRAGVRIQDENVAIAKSAYRPQITGSYNISSGKTPTTDYRTAGTVGIQLNQMLFDGFQTRNNVAAAETQVFAQRENLRNDEQNTLYQAVAAYMDVYQLRQIAALREKNLAAMNEQVRAARARLDVGEGTRTDVAQAEASRSTAIAALNAARANVKTAEATYMQIVGSLPDKLAPASAARHLPQSPSQAYASALASHPGILATKYAVNAAGYNVKAKEGALLPTIGLTASASQLDTMAGTNIGDGNSASIGVGVSIPIYTGGRTSAQIRQSKEQLGQARIEVDVVQDKVRQAISSAWSQLEAARASVAANRDGIAAAQLALDGVIEERKVGQRTTLDVLNAQNDLVAVQIALVQAEHDVVVASYALLNATGRMTADQLGLQVAQYKPEEHYKAVKDKWFGLRTPDGR
ncbi:multidrug efflux RND transporter outer membrane subunit BepC [Brucella sp. 6810]|uniref:multidrug efflux RND transporter outer membrane subunit BepC n=1 Tax=unclassified Brucella TaxID=2632610 RepID=UPI0005B42FAE|nr:MULTISPECIES: multidrug efflux RND transporter outer membrane subunit BepC [unclassified Brucella]QMV26340.1 multidrug efflux RND transporter outer membrane subunit BepC [Brucella sp. BO3]QNQ62459.1 multidrug efflux RND transporter outer membrane subunit BepC [Brucella sp. 6810]QPN27912.1 multidrug efflux RND transporter outer membrane subunit BepC [Brucella sp. BO2]